MKTATFRLLLGAAAGVCLGAGVVLGACGGDSEVAGEWIFEPEAEAPGWAINSGGDGDMGNLGLTGGAAFSTNVPPVNCDCGHSLGLPGTNGAAGAVSIGSYDPLAGAEKFTVMAWVRRESAAGENLSARIFSDADSTALTNTTAGVEFRFSGSAGNLALRINGTEVATTVGGVAPESGEWHHVAAVYDGTRAATNYTTRNVHFYVDGIQRGVGSVLQNAVVATNDAPVVVGNASASRTAANLLAGSVDDVLVLPGWAPDAAGNGNANAAIQCFMDTADDIFPPSIAAPPDVEAEAGECLEPVTVALGSATAWDDCGVALVSNDAPAVFDAGLTEVTWTASDAAGNASTAVQTVAVVPSRTGDCDEDGLTDYEEEMELGTDATLWDTDGDGWGDGEEVEMGFDPLQSSDYPKVTIHAIHYNPAGADSGKEWVELYSASLHDVDLGGFCLEVGQATGWETVLVFPTNTVLSPGRFLLIGESDVVNADLTATLGIPNAWTNEPTTGLRLARGAAARNFPVFPSIDTVFIGGGIPFNSASLDTAGWNGDHSVWAHAGCILERRLPGVDNDSHVDWTEAGIRAGRPRTLVFDGDGDGIPDGDERTGSVSGGFGPTNPWNADTDGDGLSDYEECHVFGTNPNRWDTDGDIWPWMPPGTLAGNWPGSDSYELAHGMNPLVADENANGFSDIWEVMLGSAALQNGSDTDGDGLDDLSEIRQNSNPLDSADSEPHAYVLRQESSLPGWINGEQDNDVGIGGFVRVCFDGVAAGLGACVSVQEGNVSEEYALEWEDAERVATFSSESNPGIQYASAILSPNASLLVRDTASRPDYTNTPGGEYTLADAHASLVPDWNRDRAIDAGDRVASLQGNTFRFWINNDNDDGAVGDGDSDIPDYGMGWFGRADSNNNEVDGECDLLDFFPIWIDAAALWEMLPAEGVTCCLKHPDGAVNAVWSSLSAVEAGGFLTITNLAFGPDFNQAPHHAPVVRITQSGVEMPTAFAENIAMGNGVMMVEGCYNTTNPLVFEMRRNGERIFATEMPLALSHVEEMYRWINLRPGRASDTKTGEPTNRPDGLCNGKNVIFVHGFNVTEKEAHGWNSEMFKRLHQSGSQAKYWAVTWKGDVGFFEEIHYHADVTNALDVAGAFSAVVSNVVGEKIVLAHSLGNMVVSEAIQNGLAVAKYFMLNAAVPVECYDATAFNDGPAGNDLVPSDWLAYTNVTWASKWHELFVAEDNRSRLTWRGRFSSVPSVAYNYYSSGDQVFELKPGGAGTFSGGLLHLERYAWQKQEMLKGRGALAGTTWAGWGIRHAAPDTFDPLYTPSEANEIAATNKWFFCKTPIFWPSPSFMFTASISDGRQKEILGRGIPALSSAMGNYVADVSCEIMPQTDISTQIGRPNGWGRNNAIYGTRWLHSDIKNMAYPYTYKLYDSLVLNGLLNRNEEQSR